MKNVLLMSLILGLSLTAFAGDAIMVVPEDALKVKALESDNSLRLTNFKRGARAGAETAKASVSEAAKTSNPKRQGKSLPGTIGK